MGTVRRIVLWLAALAAVAPVAAQGDDPAKQLQKLIQAFRRIEGLYVDDVETGPLVERAIERMLEELDPHSAYIGAEEMRAVRESFAGSFSGIGIEFSVQRDTIAVVNTVSGGPAERAGVRVGDRIVRIDTLQAVGMTRADVPRHLRGRKGTEVAIDIVRRGVPEPLHFRLVRDRIPLTSVDAAYKVTDGVGYIRVDRFGRTTVEEFRKAFERLGRPEALILDLRGNGGGLLDAAIGMAGFFLPRGARIVSTEGRAVPDASFEAPTDGEGLRVRLAVLVDEASASASEIVAGAMQDWDRGVIVGRRTFGKGLVQREMGLGDGSALRITVARYHTPSGRVIQRPYEEGDRRAYYLDHLHRDDAAADSLDAAAPAYRTLRTGRTVYGGGGIRPDVTVSSDTTGYTDYHAALIRCGAFAEFVAEYLDRERSRLEALYPAFEAFDEGFSVSDATLGELYACGTARGAAFDALQAERAKPLMRLQLKALVAQRLYGTGAFYRVMNAGRDGAFRRAVELLAEWDRLGAPLLCPATDAADRAERCGGPCR